MKTARVSPERDWWETIYEQWVTPPPSQTTKGAVPSFLKRFGAQVRLKRIEKGWNQRELAIRAGMKQPEISKVEDGKKNATMFTVARLCKALGITKIDF